MNEVWNIAGMLICVMAVNGTLAILVLLALRALPDEDERGKP